MGKLPTMRKTFALALTAIAASACSSLRSVDYRDATQGRGQSYYLPMQLARVTVERSKLPPEKELKEAKAAADKTAKELKDAVDAKKAEIEELKKILASIPGDPETKHQLDVAQAQLGILQPKYDAAATVAGNLAALLISGNAGKFVDNIEIKLDPAAPDPRYRFILDMDHSPFADDDWTIKTNTSGFLTSAHVKSTDQTPEILIELARLAGIGKSGGPPMPDGSAPPPVRIDIDEPFKFESVFDPTATTTSQAFAAGQPGNLGSCRSQNVDVDSLSHINACLRAIGVNFQIAVARVKPELASAMSYSYLEEPAALHTTGTTSGASDTKEGGNYVEGIVYRRPLPYVIQVLTCVHAKDNKENRCSTAQGKDAVFITKSVQVVVPNASPLEVLPYETAAFVTTQNDVEFIDGVPSEVHSIRPSEMLELVRLPGRIVEGAAESVSHISPVQVDSSNVKTDAAVAKTLEEKEK